MAKVIIPNGKFINWNFSQSKFQPPSSEITEILNKHTAWVNSEPNGKKANLSSAELSGLDLQGADLRWADLRGADLRGADLSNADLTGADMTDSYLISADLTGVMGYQQ